ncbi:ubiquinone biosynthesis O-methyltransferase, mitochondrial [Pectinophora gossypiella]|uniref:ubiquinone biosynthesis O-methyltransferase, mitochondrial n=1 Tax=Pectinophora gossypiella TaxID=13191 RepID=UPI00214F27BA|nr:ubiquinone biosynthesis O-methyltransferase, mitochondrial [Pectinophora gossypiella]
MSTKILDRFWLLRRTSYSANVLMMRKISSESMSENSKKHTLETTSTVDCSDIQHHAKMFTEWWDPRGPMKALHSFNVLRIPFIRDGLADCAAHKRTPTPLTGKTILDVGCGGGILSEPLARLGAKVVGIDASKDLVDLATRHALLDPKLSQNLPNYIWTTVEDHAHENIGVYDGVVASEIIEHVNNKHVFVRWCVHALKPGGRIFFTSPCRSKLAELSVIFIAENILNLVPKGTHQIEKFTTPNELSFLLERNNCNVEMIHGIVYNFLTKRWSWSRYQNLMFALQAVKLCEK